MVKLGVQLAQKTPTARLTRTERVSQGREQRLDYERQVKDYQILKRKVEEIKSTEFKDIKTVEEYETKYNKLSPDVKQFFQTPLEIRTQRERDIKINLSRANERISTLDREIEEQRNILKEGQKEQRSEIWILNQKRKISRKEEELYQLQQSFSKIKEGVSYSDIRSFAIEKAREKESIEQGRYERSKKPQITQKAIEQKTRQIYTSALRTYKDPEKAYRWTQKQVSEISGGQYKLPEYKEEPIQTESITQIPQTRTTLSPATIPPETVAQQDARTGKNIGKFVIKSSGKIYNIIPLFWKSPSSPLDVVKPFSFPIGFDVLKGTKNIKVKDITTDLSESILKEAEIKIKEDLILSGVEQNVKPKFEQQYQQEFENRYKGKIIEGKVTPEEAVKEFDESQYSKLLQERYSKEIQKERAKQPISTRTVGIVGRQFVGGGLKLFPTSVGGIATVSSGLYGFKEAFAITPSLLKTTFDVGLTSYGGYKFLSSKSTPEERLIGGVTAGIGAYSLGSKGIRYLRQPSLESVKILKPTGSLSDFEKGTYRTKALQKVIQETPKGTFITKKYNLFGVSEKAIAGQRTIVTTPFRKLLKLPPIYKGIPTKTVAYEQTLLFGKIKTLTPYQKAYQRLIKYGYTPYQTKSALRYTSPKLYEIRESGTVFYSYGEGIKPKFIAQVTRKIKPIVETIDVKLGIKTGGGRTTAELIKVKGSEIATINKFTKIQSQAVVQKTLVTKTGELYIPLKWKGKPVYRYYQDTLVKQSGKGDYQLMNKILGTNARVIKDIPYIKYPQRTFLTEVSPKYRPIGEIRGELKGLIKGKKTKVLRLTTEYKPTEIQKLSLKSFKEKQFFPDINKLALKRLRASQLKDIVSKRYYQIPQQQEMISRYKPSQQLQDAFRPSSQISKTQQLALEKFREGELIKVTIPNKFLKSVPLPAPRISNKIGNIVNTIEKQRVFTGFAISGGILSAPRQRFRTSTTFKVQDIEATILKNELSLKNIQSQKTSQKLSSNIVSPKISPIISPVIPPSVFYPRTPKIPKTPSIPLFFSEPLMKKVKTKKQLKNLIKEQLYLPDFTSRVLGLDPEFLSEKQAKKKLNKLMTGLEIRRPIKIKNWN